MNLPEPESLKSIGATEFWERSKTIPVLDVRSPCEFFQGHIPDAVNVPLFSDEQRCELGTMYKKVGREPAIAKGLEIGNQRAPDLIAQSRKYSQDGEVLVHCWRGGMRSQAFTHMLQLDGLTPVMLEGGYKTFRTMVREAFGIVYPLIVISGYTGAGKTDVLKHLHNAGEQVIDLEHLANHRGSAFGGIGQRTQPRTEQFENELFSKLDHLDLSRTIWIEDEGNRIGSVVVPNAIYDQIRHALAVSIECDLNHRIDVLMKDYGDLPPDQLIYAITKIKKRLGGLAVQQATEAVESGNVSEAIRIVLAYYDKTYLSAMKAMPRNKTLQLKVDDLPTAEVVASLKEIASEITRQGSHL